MTHKILYIEGHPDNVEYVKRALEARGYDILWAQNGEEGVELAGKQEPDVILLDINLPDTDGFEVTRRLRKSGKSHLLYVPIIAIIANTLRGDAERAIAAGCDVYLSKPINIRELWSQIEAFIPIDDLD